MKFKIAVLLTLLFSVPQTSHAAGFADSIGVLTGSRHEGRWMFSEIRELDGRLSGCFASTSPTQGGYSFENSDLSLLAYRDEGALVRRIGLADVAVPGQDMFITGIIMSDSEMIGQNLGGYVAGLMQQGTRPNEHGRFEISAKLSDGMLDDLAEASEAAIKIGGRDKPIYYSLRGSAAALRSWSACTEEL